MTRLNQVLLSILLLLFTFQVQSQTTTDKFTPVAIEDEMTLNPEQNKMWRTGQSRYSAKPKSMWELGIHAGTAFVSGDVEAPFPAGYGFGLHLRKAINYTLSWRLEASYQTSKGYDARDFNFLSAERTFTQNVDDTPQLLAYTDEFTHDDNIHRNYKANILAFTVEGILNIGNVLFHNPSNKWNFYGVIGAGLDFPKTSVDLLNGDQPYDFSGVNSGLDLTTQDGRNESRKRLKELLDGDFETEGGVEQDFISLGDYKTIIPHFTFGVGLSRKLSKRINLGFEHRIIISDNDLLDAFENRTSYDESTSNDIPHYSSVRLGINLGSFEKRIEPLYWVNPLDGPLNDIAELKQRPKFDLTDTDGDGVIDMTDQQINTPAGCPVDTRGIMLDSDGDDVVDCKDKQPYSPPGFEVDGDGVAINDNPPMGEKDVADLIDQRTNAFAASLNWFLPIIHFDLDKYFIKPEFYGPLHNVAAVMKSHPDLKVVATGYADNRNPNDYNNVLSYNRANETINYLVTNYNLPRSRFILNFGGEDQPLAKDLKDDHSTSRTQELAHYINRRVEFRVATNRDIEQSRPSGPEAGKNTPGSSRPGTKYSGNFNSGY